MKKVLAILLVAVMLVSACFAFSGCDKKPVDDTKKVKVGLICLHGEQSTYDKNFIDAFKAGCAAQNVELLIKTDIAEGEACYETACDLVDQGCNVIFADSFGHEPFMAKAAKEYPNVTFAHATGTTAHDAGIANLKNAFANIFQGRYLAGFVAGMKLAEMEKAGQITEANKENGKIKVGYVGAFTYAEVMSGYSSWFLGVKAGYADSTGTDAATAPICMKVQFTGSWYDEAAERSAAQTLISLGCALISQHADSMGAPSACEAANVPNVSYNGSTATACPNTFIISSRINWQPYCELLITSARDGKNVDADFVGTLDDKSVLLTELGKNAPAGAQAKIDAVSAQLKSGALKVFNCDMFTVGGVKLTSYKADVNTDAAFTPDTEVIKTANGVTYFAESEFRSAPYFDVRMDDIELLNQMF